jgi:branched-chain amino acid transport system ATP-binding protein
MTENQLMVDGASKRFGGVVANDKITLAVPRGSIIGLIGPNGSGKTTLFNSIVGYHSGLRVPEIARRGLLRTFQQTRIYGKMTCVENMKISVPHTHQSFRTMFSKYPPEIAEKAESLLEFVGLYAKRYLLAGDLSFGQQKLLEFAMALMNEPKMMLLDEPTAGINPTLINGLIERLKRTNADLGITLFVIEHNMRAIMNLAEHIYCLAHGQLLTSGPPEEIQQDQKVIDAYLGAE